MRNRDSEQISIPPDGRPDSEQPQWRQDFPIDWPQDDYIARRDFTKFLVLTSFAFSIGQFWILLQNYLRSRRGQPPVRAIAEVGSIPVGGSMTFDYPEHHDNCLLVRTGEDRYVAYSQKCTHLSCPVKPKEGSESLHCPCHNGSFDIATGRPTGGPPRRPLPLVTLEIRNGKIYATNVEERLA